MDIPYNLDEMDEIPGMLRGVGDADLVELLKGAIQEVNSCESAVSDWPGAQANDPDFALLCWELDRIQRYHDLIVGEITRRICERRTCDRCDTPAGGK